MNLEDASLIVWNFLNRMNRPYMADVIFVHSESGESGFNKAILLYKEGLARFIAVNMTLQDFEGAYEADQTPKHLKCRYKRFVWLCKANHIDQSNIIFVGVDGSFLEEVRRGEEFLIKNIRNLSRVIVVSRPVYQLRTLLAWRKRYPHLSLISCPSDDVFSFEDCALRERMLQELDRLERHHLKDEIANPHITAEVLSAAEIIKSKR